METTYDKIMADIEETAATMSDTFLPVSCELGAVNAARLYKLQSEIRGHIHTLIRTKDCTAIKPVASARRGVLGSTDIFVKRMIRKMTLWLVEPAWKQQRIFNNTLASTVSRIAETQDELLKGLIYLSKEIDEMKKL